MALIEKETLLKGLWDLVLIVASGTVCVGGSYFVVGRAMAKAAAQMSPPPPGTAGLSPTGFVPLPGTPAEAVGGHEAGELKESHESEKDKEGGEKKKKKKSGKEGEKSEKDGLVYPLRTTVVNLAADSNHRFAKVSITLQADSKEGLEELKTVDHQVYDCLIETLGNVRAQDIGTDAGKDLLKETLRHKMNKFLTDGEITNVYLTEFLVQ